MLSLPSSQFHHGPGACILSRTFKSFEGPFAYNLVRVSLSLIEEGVEFACLFGFGTIIVDFGELEAHLLAPKNKKTFEATLSNFITAGHLDAILDIVFLLQVGHFDLAEELLSFISDVDDHGVGSLHEGVDHSSTFLFTQCAAELFRPRIIILHHFLNSFLPPFIFFPSEVNCNRNKRSKHSQDNQSSSEIHFLV